MGVISMSLEERQRPSFGWSPARRHYRPGCRIRQSHPAAGAAGTGYCWCIWTWPWCTPRPLTGDQGRAGTVATTTRPSTGRGAVVRIPPRPHEDLEIEIPDGGTTTVAAKSGGRRAGPPTRHHPRLRSSKRAFDSTAAACLQPTGGLLHPGQFGLTVRSATDLLHLLRRWRLRALARIGTPLAECQDRPGEAGQGRAR